MSIPIGRKCRVHNCTNPEVAKGLCDKHRKRIARHGVLDDSVGKVEIEGYAKLEHHPLYEVWRNITRSEKGTLVCERWKKFKNFVEDVKQKPDGTFRLVRIDRSGLFSLENVRWDSYTKSEDERRTQAEKMREWSRENRKNNSDYYFERHLKKYYKMTVEEYLDIFNSQEGLCKICGTLPHSKASHGG